MSHPKEIDLIALLQLIMVKKRFIVKLTVVFFVFGVVVSVILSPEYQSSTKFIPNTATNPATNLGGNLGGLASLAGLELNSGTGSTEIPPQLYIELIESIPFKRKVLDAPLFLSESNDTVTYKKYYTDIYKPGILTNLRKYTLGLPVLIIKSVKGNSQQQASESFKGEQIIQVSETERELFGRLRDQIDIEYSSDDGMVIITFRMPKPIMAARMTEYVRNLLQEELIKFKIKKAKEQLVFTEKLFREKKKEFEESQTKLAEFQDRNMFLSTAKSKSTLERLSSEYDLSFNVYSGVANQLEEAKLQVSRDTPIFSIIQPVSVPNQKSFPNRVFVILIWTFSGLFLAVFYLLLRELVAELKKRLLETL